MKRGDGNRGRSLALAIALALPGSALALGLGEARVDSFLNQPLDVRMRLLDTSADELDTLTVSSASPEEYQRLGLGSRSLALDLEVTLDRSQDPPVVRVRSRRPVSDPVLQLLIDARWSSGRMLREYTLFLDPATVPVAPPPAVRPAPDSTPERQPGVDRVPAERPSTRPRDESPAPAPRAVARVSADRYGPVVSGETLWSIAQAHLRPGVTMDQMMLAIVELNPGAFRDRNVNRLMRGARLEFPDADQARALDPATAAAMVAEQNRAFRRGTADLPVVSDAARGRADDNSSGQARPTRRDPETTDHRLALVPPTDADGGSGLSSDDADVEVLREQLARTEEELFAARQEAEEFRSRVGELEELVRNNPDGIGVRDGELAGLEQTLREAREATREESDPEFRQRVSERLEDYIEQFETAAVSGAAASNGGDSQAAAEPSGASAAESDAAAADAGQAPAEANAVTPPERVVTEVGGQRGFLQRLMTGTTGLALAGLVVLLALIALVGVVLRRKRREADAATPVQRPPEPPAPVKPPPPADPVARAREAVEDAPKDLGRHVDLLRTLAGEGQEGAFSDALEEMFEHVDTGQEPEWREALDLAERVAPGHALVKGSSDWVAAPDSDQTGEAATELDREAEVDDLMSRLDADLDESDESDDRDWVGGEATESKPEPDGPLLREDDTGDQRSDHARRSDAASAQGQDDAPASDLADDDLGLDWPDDDDAPASGDAPTGSERGSREASDANDDLLLDWPDDEGLESTLVLDKDELPGDTDDGGRDPTLVLDEDELPGDGDEDDEIFAQGDDDVDVKLDLARAYLSWNSNDSAKTLLEEILQEGNDEQREEARRLLDEIGDDS